VFRLHHDKRRLDRERGSALIVVVVTLVALLSIGAVTILSVQAELTSTGQRRYDQQALYAAESGVAAGMEFLRTNCASVNAFSGLVNQNNVNPQHPAGIVGNEVAPGGAGNPFGAETQAWYEVYILNNTNDPGFALVANNDQDATVILQVTGHGPNDTRAVLEVEVYNASCMADYCWGSDAQQNIDSLNSGQGACAAVIAGGGGSRTFTP
jgi:hypothetical protein